MKKINKTDLIKKNDLEKTRKLKEKYFEYYDDVKSPTHKVTDW